ncbi:MAG: phosphatase PAP2 family protein [Dehalococcoidia bacterium]
MELALYIGAYTVYMLSRGLVFPGEQIALSHADWVIAVEQALGFFWEPGWQAWTVANAPGLVVVLNWIYILTYWPIILGLAIVLYLIRRRTYGYYRNVMVVHLLLALLVFTLFPLAPPYMVSAYFIDTIQTFGPTFYGGTGMAPYYNNLAAMPSLHFSWSVIFGVLFFRNFKGWFKISGVLYPVLTFFAITITGNHYILDALVGGALAGIAFAVLDLVIKPRLWLRWRKQATTQ